MKKIKQIKAQILLEVLLSIVILSAGVSVILNAMVSAKRSNKMALEYMYADLFLENELFEYLSPYEYSDLQAQDEKANYEFNVNKKEFNDNLSYEDVSLADSKNLNQMDTELFFYTSKTKKKKMLINMLAYDFTKKVK